MDISPSSPSMECEISTSDVTILEGHTSEVYDILSPLVFRQPQIILIHSLWTKKDDVDELVWGFVLSRFAHVHGALLVHFLHLGECFRKLIDCLSLPGVNIISLLFDFNDYVTFPKFDLDVRLSIASNLFIV